MIDLEIHMGEHVSAAFCRAVAIANRLQACVRVEFNGVLIDVVPGDSADSMVAKWKAETNRQALAYRNSPEWLANTECRRASDATDQDKVDASYRC